MREYTKEQVIIGCANNSRNVKNYWAYPREQYILAIVYKPLNLIFDENIEKENAESFLESFISDAKFSYGLDFTRDEFEIREY